MPPRDPRIDAYIAKAPAFAKPILAHIREVVHEACPDVEETIKWNNPNFMYKGMLCGMASFKEHCAFSFWKGFLILDTKNGAGASDAAGNFGRITKVADLPPPKTLKEYVKKAMRLNEEGTKVRREPKSKKPALRAPPYFMNALKKNKKALETYEAFSPSKKREYIEWVSEAKSEETREKRLETAVAWMAEGKSRNWKYQT